MSTAPKRPHYADGEVFEMSLDFGALESQPWMMVDSDGYGEFAKWKFKGKRLTGTQTRKFKWVSVGYRRNFWSLRTALRFHGKTPEGQWREAVKALFQHDGVHCRGIADASWVDPRRRANFPCVRSDGNSEFYYPFNGFHVNWRWLVQVVE